MAKLDKSKPNIIPVHKKNPELAKEIVEVMNDTEQLEKQSRRLQHLMELNDAKREVLWDKVEEQFEEDLRVIAPDNHLEWDIDGDEVYIKKCEKKLKMPAFPDVLKKMMEDITGGKVQVGVGEFPPKRR